MENSARRPIKQVSEITIAREVAAHTIDTRSQYSLDNLSKSIITQATPLLTFHARTHTPFTHLPKLTHAKVLPALTHTKLSHRQILLFNRGSVLQQHHPPSLNSSTPSSWYRSGSVLQIACASARYCLANDTWPSFTLNVAIARGGI